VPPADDFTDLLDANRAYARGFRLAGVPARAARGLAVVTCMDSRIEPLSMLGLAPGDAKIVRNAGARVTDDVLRTLVLAVNLLGVDRIALVGHTDCTMTAATDAELQTELESRYPGAGAPSWRFLTIADPRTVLLADLQRIRDCPLLPPDLVLGAFRYDVASGALHTVR